MLMFLYIMVALGPLGFRLNMQSGKNYIRDEFKSSVPCFGWEILDLWAPSSGAGQADEHGGAAVSSGRRPATAPTDFPSRYGPSLGPSLTYLEDATGSPPAQAKAQAKVQADVAAAKKCWVLSKLMRNELMGARLEVMSRRSCG